MLRLYEPCEECRTIKFSIITEQRSKIHQLQTNLEEKMIAMAAMEQELNNMKEKVDLLQMEVDAAVTEDEGIRD